MGRGCSDRAGPRTDAVNPFLSFAPSIPKSPHIPCMTTQAIGSPTASTRSTTTSSRVPSSARMLAGHSGAGAQMVAVGACCRAAATTRADLRQAPPAHRAMEVLHHRVPEIRERLQEDELQPPPPPLPASPTLIPPTPLHPHLLWCISSFFLLAGRLCRYLVSSCCLVDQTLSTAGGNNPSRCQLLAATAAGADSLLSCAAADARKVQR